MSDSGRFKSISNSCVEPASAQHARTAEVSVPGWLGVDAELVLDLICLPAEPLDPVRGRSPIGLAASTIVVLALCGCAALALRRMYSGYALTASPKIVGDNLKNEFAFVHAEYILSIASISLFALWYGVLIKRARAVATVRPIYSVYYALVALLVPIANLIGPIQILNHLWISLSRRRTHARSYLTWSLIGLWWAMVIGAVVLGGIAAQHSQYFIDKESYVRAFTLAAQAQLIYVIVCGASILVVLVFTMRLFQSRVRASRMPGQLQALPISHPVNATMALSSVFALVALCCVAVIARSTQSFVGLAAYCVAMGLAKATRSLWKPLFATSAIERLHHDHRRPILLLRAFGQGDRLLAEKDSLENAIESAARAYGPVVTLGRPGESFGSGAAGRLYVPQQRWKPIAKALIDTAQCIVIPCIAGEGLRWELEQICQHGHLGKVVFVPARVGFFKARWGLWDKFLSICPPAISVPMSTVIGDLEYILYITITGPCTVAEFRGNPTEERHGALLQSILMNLGASSTPRS